MRNIPIAQIMEISFFKKEKYKLILQRVTQYVFPSDFISAQNTFLASFHLSFAK